MSHTFVKSVDIVWSSLPNLRSEATATHWSPVIASTAPPLYPRIDMAVNTERELCLKYIMTCLIYDVFYHLSGFKIRV